MRREDLVDLNAFLAVAEEKSFTRAAARLGTSQSALSNTIRRLEAKLGIHLLTRTTRSVAPTAAGDLLLETLRPALDSIDARLASLGEVRGAPSGTIRLSAPDHAAQTILWPALRRFMPTYPDVQVELIVESDPANILTGRFDGGVRLGESLTKDVIAVAIGPDLRMAVVGSPAYFAEHQKPIAPDDLEDHRCINLRCATGSGLDTWDLKKNGREVRVSVDGQLVFNTVGMILDAAMAGFGLAFVLEDQAQAAIAEGRLVRVMEDWCPAFSGYHLYYPDRHEPSAAFRLLVEALRYQGP